MGAAKDRTRKSKNDSRTLVEKKNKLYDGVAKILPHINQKGTSSLSGYHADRRKWLSIC